ncbi:MAG: TerC family protein [Rubricoccaceae bacterium]|nr:TerC family protein [Rubricoccaceae bacterium]
MHPTHLEVPGQIWIGLNVFVVVLLLIDLFGFNRKAHKIGIGEAARTSAFFVAAAALVNTFVWLQYGTEAGLTFLTGYIVEMSLSVDNLFVIAVLFGYFSVPANYQHRVLFWGVFGAIVMRAIMILLGVSLVARFDWLLYIFGVFLIITGARLLFKGEETGPPRHEKVLNYLRRVLPVTRGYYGEHFFVKKLGRLWVTPLFLVLLMIEFTDVLFAVDSIPAILGITTDPFLAYSSNIMAVVGLRALYFLLAGLIERLRFLNISLGLVLVFIGIKMLVAEYIHVPTWVSLIVIASLISIGMILSLLYPVAPETETEAATDQS